MRENKERRKGKVGEQSMTGKDLRDPEVYPTLPYHSNQCIPKRNVRIYAYARIIASPRGWRELTWKLEKGEQTEAGFVSSPRR